MADQLSEDNLRRRFLECGVCLQNFDQDQRQPLTLPCQHPFCHSCLRNILKSQQIVCPFCKASHKVQDGDLTVFPKDRSKLDMLDFLSQASQPKPERCTNCDEHTAETRCESCQDSLCTECTSAHRRTKLTSGHVLVSVHQQATDSLIQVTDPSHCSKPGHSKYLLDRYCETEVCQHLVCELCCKQTHRGHSIKKTTEVYKTRKNDLASLIDKLKSKGHLNERVKLNLKDDKERVTEEADIAKSQVEETYEAFTKVLKSRKNELFEKLNKFRDEKMKCLDTQLENIQFQDAKLSNIFSWSTQLMEADEISFLKLDRALKLEIDQILDRTDSKEHVPKTTIKAYVNEQVELFEDIAKGLVSLSDLHIDFQRTKVTTSDGVVSVPNNVLEIRLYEPDGTVIKHTDMDIDVEVLSDRFVRSTLKAQFSDKTDCYLVTINTPDAGKYRANIRVLGQKVDQEAFFNIKESSLPGTQQTDHQHRLSCSNSEDRPRLENLKSYSTENSSETTRIKELPGSVSLVDSSFSPPALPYICSTEISAVVQNRFKTWNLSGEWEQGSVQTHGLIMYSRTKDEARLCLHILKDTVLEKTILVKPETMVVLQSDKWQGVLNRIRSKYTSSYDKVEVSVDHANNRLLCYSLSTVALKDVADTIFIFLRDNDVKVVRLKYTEDIVRVVKEAGQQRITAIQTSLSQFCVNVKGDKDIIEIRGIRFGVCKAMLEVHETVKELLAEEEERFSSDDEEGDKNESGDSLSRFASKNVVINAIEMNICSCKFYGMYMIGDDRMVFVSDGDLTTYRVDALVNAADKRLKHDGGLAKAIVMKGGYAIQAECSEFVFNNGDLKEGCVFCSRPGKLECHVIIHAVGPVWRRGADNEIQKLKNTVANILTEASVRKLASVVFPAICTGKNKFPPKEAALSITEAVKDFFIRNPRSVLREVHLCDRDATCVQSLMEACEDVFGVKDSIRTARPTAITADQAANAKERIHATVVC